MSNGQPNFQPTFSNQFLDTNQAVAADPFTLGSNFMPQMNIPSQVPNLNLGGMGFADSFGSQYGGGSALALPSGGGTPSGSAPSFWQTPGGMSRIGPEGPTMGQRFFGGIGAEGEQYKGLGSGLFSLGTAGMGAYLGYKNMKLAQSQLDQQQDQWMKNYAAQRHAYNQNAASINVARASRKGGAYQIKEMPKA